MCWLLVCNSTVSRRGHLFYVDFLFFIFTSHRGGNVSTAVRTFPPLWEHSHRGENIPTAVRTFPPRWEHCHRGEKYFHRDLWRHHRAPPSRADMRHHSSHYWNSMEHRQVHLTRVWSRGRRSTRVPGYSSSFIITRLDNSVTATR